MNIAIKSVGNVYFLAALLAISFSPSASAATVSAGDIAAFETASGTWRVRVSGDGWEWTLDQNPGWSSAMACNEGSGSRLATVGHWTMAIPAYTCRFAQDDAPVRLNGERIKAAVQDGRWVAYDPARAASWPTGFGQTPNTVGSLTKLGSSIYDPLGDNGTGSSSTIVGVISGQGGEYNSSRGAADDADAEAIAIAISGADVSIHTEALYVAAFASAGFPYRTPFSGSVLRDPQKPLSGLQYEYRVGGSEVTADIESVIPDKLWRYDPSHLANSGWALWLGTEDPRIGLIVQSHAAFALATRPEYKRVAETSAGRMEKYRCMESQERALFNCLNAMWRARDVASRVNSDNVMLWSNQRVQEMYAETTSQITTLVEATKNAPMGATTAYANKIASAPFDRAGCAPYSKGDGSTFYAVTKSNFQDQQYGAIPTYLRARSGEALGRSIFEIITEQMVARTLYIGGAAGVDGRRSQGGSGLPLSPCTEIGNSKKPETPTFTDSKGWAEWVEQQNIVSKAGVNAPTDSLSTAAGHTAIQIDFILRAARELADRGDIQASDDLDNAIAAFDQARAATASGTMKFPIWHKHAAAPINIVDGSIDTGSNTNQPLGVCRVASD